MAKDARPHQPSSRAEGVRLDQVLKSLFSVSSPVLIGMLNSLFHETYADQDTEVTVTSNEFILENFDLIRGDLFFRLTAQSGKTHHYHIDFQTASDHTMAIRMFDYDLAKARENASEGEARLPAELVITLPKQLVIFIEPHRQITDHLTIRLIFPNGQEMIHTIGVLKYWEYTPASLVQEKLYSLLPLQVFILRSTLHRISRRDNQTDLKQAIDQTIQRVREVAEKSTHLYKQDLITGNDLNIIMTAVNYLFQYLNHRYFHHETLNQEVGTMLKSIFDPTLEERSLQKGKREGRREGIRKGIRKGKREGRREGEREGERNILHRLITRKFGQITPELTQQIKALNSEELDVLAEELLDFQTLTDLTNWLERRQSRK